MSLIYPIGCTPACQYAAKLLSGSGVPIIDHPTPEITHLMLDVPSFSADRKLKNGKALIEYLDSLPDTVTLIGGNFPKDRNYRAIDLMQIESYVMENAAITAQCALSLAAGRMRRTYRDANVLIVGWGRIGKHLAKLLQAFGAQVTVLSRKDTHIAEVRSFGLDGISIEALPELIRNFHVIFNTAPEMTIPESLSRLCPNCLKIELASSPGIGGSDVVCARGLPGIHAPESSGTLIYKTILPLIKEGKL